MEIRNINQNFNTVNFKAAVNTNQIANGIQEIGQTITKSTAKAEEKVKAPWHLEMLSKPMRKLAPFVEKKFVQKKLELEDLINVGNCFKEMVCMIVYPLQVLTNPDIPKEKRRFVGMYDFFVTCFSLGGTLLYALKGKPIVTKLVNKGMNKYIQANAAKFNTKLSALKSADKAVAAKGKTLGTEEYANLARVLSGGIFVLGIAIQTIIFKRILAPALSPPLAAKVRARMEAKDAARAKANGTAPQAQAPAPAEKKEEAKPAEKTEKPENTTAASNETKSLLDPKEFKFAK